MFGCLLIFVNYKQAQKLGGFIPYLKANVSSKKTII